MAATIRQRERAPGVLVAFPPKSDNDPDLFAREAANGSPRLDQRDAAAGMDLALGRMVLSDHPVTISFSALKDESMPSLCPG
jgi:hypothetical protein